MRRLTSAAIFAMTLFTVNAANAELRHIELTTLGMD